MFMMDFDSTLGFPGEGPIDVHAVYTPDAKCRIEFDNAFIRGVCDAVYTPEIGRGIDLSTWTSKALSELMSFNDLVDAKLKTRRQRRDLERFRNLSFAHQSAVLHRHRIYVE